METVLRYVELIVKPSTTAQDIRKDRISLSETFRLFLGTKEAPITLLS